MQRLRADSLEDSPRPPGYVPCTTWWWTDDDRYLGRIALRHRLTPFLLEVGGHVGYDVRPSARRHGHATAMLRAVLPQVRAHGIDRALMTCDHDNLGSRKVIEANGGRLEDRRGVKLRFWVPTSCERGRRPLRATVWAIGHGPSRTIRRTRPNQLERRTT